MPTRHVALVSVLVSLAGTFGVPHARAAAPSAFPNGWPDEKQLAELDRKKTPYLYRESSVPKYELPDPLLCADGTRVTTREQWEQKRRPETLELFRRHVYGHSPAAGEVSFSILETDPHAVDGKATRKRIKITSTQGGQQGKSFSFEASLLTPNDARGKVPAFVLNNNRPVASADPTRAEKNGFWPAEDILARGYAAAVFRTVDVDPDKDGSAERAKGVRGVWPMDDSNGDAWATIAAWAWGASRVLDYLQTDPAIDAAHVAVVGHSRGGKTALWAAAQDTRFAMAGSNCSGRGGASLARRRMGETLKRINTAFPYWFANNYKKYNDKEDDCPVDQHQLIALIAPRPVYVVSAETDFWADPRGEFTALTKASPVYALYNLAGPTNVAEMPEVGKPLARGHQGYHIHPGGHNLTPFDWKGYMDFADQMWRTPAH
jgi:hypothetical protein